jgi:DnaK suppressor protein
MAILAAVDVRLHPVCGGRSSAHRRVTGAALAAHVLKRGPDALILSAPDLGIARLEAPLGERPRMLAKKTSTAVTGQDDATKTAAEPAGPARKSSRAKKPSPPKLAVRSGERAWTAGQIAEVRATLQADADRLEAEIGAVEQEIAALMREGGEGAGHDQADVGSNTFERDHEMTLARNARENLVLVREALDRIDNGTYGVCESCGQAIGKARLQAFPRATLCMECKQRQERR